MCSMQYKCVACSAKFRICTKMSTCVVSGAFAGSRTVQSVQLSGKGRINELLNQLEGCF